MKIKCLLVDVSECVRFARAAGGGYIVRRRVRGACRAERRRETEREPGGKETSRHSEKRGERERMRPRCAGPLGMYEK